MKRFFLACILACPAWNTAFAQPMCVPQGRIATHGIRLGDSEANVRRLLAKPLRIANGTAEDDGGAYPTRTLDDGSLEVTLGRDRVESIVIKGRHHSIAAGLSIGASVDRLRSKALIDNSDLAPGAAFGIRFCGAEKLPIAGLSIFVAHNRVTNAKLYAYGP